ncbi:hypothetical protein OPIT5_04870 [Opitutaceae bacterium TAV5]|nr:hypothetical protein OPIT5_04870 [Opitutaceae bacterium TAV5]
MNTPTPIKSRSRRWIVGITVLAVAIAAGLWWWQGGALPPDNGATGSSAAPADPETAQTAVVAAHADQAPWRQFAATHPVLLVVTDADWPWAERQRAVNDLATAALTPELLAACFDYLRSPVPAEEKPAMLERAIRNDLLNVLRTRTDETLALVPVLAEQAADPAQDSALRDYALQHLATWAPRLPEAEQQLAVETLCDTLKAREASYAGTALLGLYDMSNRETRTVSLPGLDLPAEAIRIATDKSMGLHSRIGALALCQQMQVASDDLVALALNWQTDSTLPEPARRAASAYLSQRSR